MVWDVFRCWMEALNSACVDFSYCKCILEMLDVGPESITRCVRMIVCDLRWNLEATSFFPNQNLKTTRHVFECLCNRWRKSKPRYWIRRGKPPSAFATLNFERKSQELQVLFCIFSPNLLQNQGATCPPSLHITRRNTFCILCANPSFRCTSHPVLALHPWSGFPKV